MSKKELRQESTILNRMSLDDTQQAEATQKTTRPMGMQRPERAIRIMKTVELLLQGHNHTVIAKMVGHSRVTVERDIQEWIRMQPVHVRNQMYTDWMYQQHQLSRSDDHKDKREALRSLTSVLCRLISEDRKRNRHSYAMPIQNYTLADAQEHANTEEQP